MCAMAVLYAPTCGDGNKSTTAHTRLCNMLFKFSDSLFLTAGEFNCEVFLLKHKDRFLKSVNTHAIARALQIEKVIPGDLCFKLERTGNVNGAEMLFLHMKDNSTLETVHRLCDVMIKKEGYPRMTSLGRDMKEGLPVSVA